jgi:hypothetical protein
MNQVLFSLLFLCHQTHALKGRWFANGKKPAPFSKKYRDANPDKAKYGGYDAGSSSGDDDISNTKMLMFFGVCFVAYFMWSRKNSGGRAPRSSAMGSGGGNTLGTASSTSTSSTASSNPNRSSSSSTTTTTTSSSSSNSTTRDAAKMREARLKALERLDSNMAKAAQTAKTSSVAVAAVHKKTTGKSNVRQRPSGGVHGFSSSSSSPPGNSSASHADATADDRARLIFPEDKDE